MSCLSFLTPAFTLSCADTTSMQQSCADNLGVASADIELLAIVPLCEAPESSQLAFRIKSSTFSLSALETLLVQKEQLQKQLELSKSTLSTCTEQIQENKTVVRADETYSKKLRKLDEDNKKLRRLLKSQLDKAESLRLATQRTVENLREEFDSLVKELMNVKGKQKDNEAPKPTAKKPFIPALKI